MEIPKYLKENEKNVLELFLTFKNCPPLDVEHQNPSFSFALRLLYRYFLDNNSEVQFTKFMQDTLKRFNPISVQDSLRLIVEHYRRFSKLADSEFLVIYFAFDEYQRADGTCDLVGCIVSPSKEHTYLSHITKDCGNLIVSPPSTNVLFFPLLVGLDLNLLKKSFDSSQYSTISLPMSFISSNRFLSLIEKQELIIGHFPKNSTELVMEKIPSELLQQTTFRQHINWLGGVVQNMVMYVVELLKFKRLENLKWSAVTETHCESALSAVKNKFYLPKQAITFNDLAHAIVQEKILPNDVHWSSKNKPIFISFNFIDFSPTPIAGQKEGCWAISKGKILIPPINLVSFVDQMKTLMKQGTLTSTEIAIVRNLQEFISIMDSNTSSYEKFERFGAFYTALKHNCFLLLQEHGDVKNITLERFHTGAQTPREFKDIVLVFKKPSTILTNSTALSANSTTLIESNGSIHNLESTENVFLNQKGKGVDSFKIWFDYKGNRILDMDQRKDWAEKVQSGDVLDAITKARPVVPNFFLNNGNFWVLGVFGRRFAVDGLDENFQPNKEDTVDDLNLFNKRIYTVGSNERYTTMAQRSINYHS